MKIGDRVAVSDGTPEPPKRHNRKHETWRMNNFEGRVYDFDSNGRIGINPTPEEERPVIVYAMDPREVDITVIDENPEADEAPEDAPGPSM